MDKQIDSEFVNKNPIEFLHQQPLISEPNLFDEDDEETREFLLLEQTLQQENNEEPLFNLLRKQVEDIKIAINENQTIEKDEDEENLNSMINFQDQQQADEKQIMLRAKKKISFDANSFVTRESSQLVSSNGQEAKNRPLTIYIPNTKQDLDLINHLTTLGHDIESFKQQIQLMPGICLGYLWKECSSSENNWRKRYFVFDRQSKLFMYFKSFKHYCKQKEAKDVVYFEDIKNVYPDHIRNMRNVEKSSKYYANFTKKSRSIFIVRTNKKDFVLSTFSPQLMRLWIDIIFTGAEAYENFY